MSAIDLAGMPSIAAKIDQHKVLLIALVCRSFWYVSQLVPRLHYYAFIDTTRYIGYSFVLPEELLIMFVTTVLIFLRAFTY